MEKIRVTIWNEFKHEKERADIRAIYPDGMHKAIADGIAAPDLEIRLAAFDEPEHGLSPAVLDETDVLFWWGHLRHQEVADEIVDRVQRRVLEGMGLVVLHSGHASKIFCRLLGTSCSLKWREAGEKERVWNIDPAHPIARGVPEQFLIPHTEMYGERFDIPDDAHVVFLSWFEGGEVFRSGVTFRRGGGRIFYFAPGHESYPIYHDATVLRILGNAARWAKSEFSAKIGCPMVEPLETIHSIDPREE